MNFVMFENGQEIGEVTEWGYIIGKVAPQKADEAQTKASDTCVFRSPAPLDITASHSVVFDGKILIEVQILTNSNGLYQALIKSKRQLTKQMKKAR